MNIVNVLNVVIFHSQTTKRRSLQTNMELIYQIKVAYNKNYNHHKEVKPLAAAWRSSNHHLSIEISNSILKKWEGDIKVLINIHNNLNKY